MRSKKMKENLHTGGKHSSGACEKKLICVDKHIGYGINNNLYF